MSGSGTTGSTVIASSGTLTIDGNGGKTLDGRTLSNAGTATLTGGTLNLPDGATLNNQAGATFSLLSDSILLYGNSATTSYIHNAGTIR
jgi:hypothetical protein